MHIQFVQFIYVSKIYISYIEATKFPEIIALMKTWRNRYAANPISWLHLSISRPQSVAARRMAGGVSLHSKPGISMQLIIIIIYRTANKNFQIVFARTGGILIAATYISPAAPLGEYTECLKIIQRTCRGLELLLGDRNERHRIWDTRTTAKGTRLIQCANTYRWRIHAPDALTFRTSRGNSTIDLMLVKGMRGANPSVISDC